MGMIVNKFELPYLQTGSLKWFQENIVMETLLIYAWYNYLT